MSVYFDEEGIFSSFLSFFFFLNQASWNTSFVVFQVGPGAQSLPTFQFNISEHRTPDAHLVMEREPPHCGSHTEACDSLMSSAGYKLLRYVLFPSNLLLHVLSQDRSALRSFIGPKFCGQSCRAIYCMIYVPAGKNWPCFLSKPSTTTAGIWM